MVVGRSASEPHERGRVVILADTHRRHDHGISGHLRKAVGDATAVIHAGDFTTEAVLDALDAIAIRLFAVYGNNDDVALRDRLPARRTVSVAGIRLVVVHGHEHSLTAAALLARQEEAPVAVVGHSHRPGVERADEVTVVNPGSHTQPRGHRPGYAVLDPAAGRGQLREPDGTHIESFDLDQ